MSIEQNEYQVSGEIYGPRWGVWLNSRFVIYVGEGYQPCAFHRWMQRLFFGFVWRRNL